MEFLTEGSSLTQSLVGFFILIMGEMVRRAVMSNTIEQRKATAGLEKLSSALDALKSATEAETRVIRADLAVHERRLDGHDDTFRRMGVRRTGAIGEAGEAGSTP